MSKMHFIAIAKAIAAIHSRYARALAAQALANACEGFNPRFNRDRFIEACNVEETEEQKPSQRATVLAD